MDPVRANAERQAYVESVVRKIAETENDWDLSSDLRQFVSPKFAEALKNEGDRRYTVEISRG
jgi:hypothetical protein